MADNKEIRELQEKLGDLRSIASDVGTSLRDTFKGDNVKALKGELNSSLLIFNKINNALGNTSLILDKVAKKEISRKNLAKEINELVKLEAKIEAEINKANQAKNLNNKKAQKAQKELLFQLGEQKRAIQDQRKEIEEATKSYKGQNSVVGSLQKKWEDIEESFTRAGMQLFVWKAILDAALNFNKISTNIGKNLGYSASQADKITNDIVNAARGSENLNFNLKNAGEAANELNIALGGVAVYSADALETQIMLTKQLGLTGEEAAGIYKFSLLTAKSSAQINDEMVGAFTATRNTVKGSADFKKTMAEVAKISGQLAANFKNNPADLTKAVVQAQALGTTLAQTKDQGKQLLDFESSIESELKAELLTGQAMNLERARAAALQGDQVTVMKELANQGMTLNKFQNMNVIAQESFAKALGLTADQLADQLTKQKIAKEQGKSLAQITKEEALEAEKRQNIQDRFNAAMDKLKDIIGGIVAGPLGMMLSILSDALGLISSIVSGIQAVMGSGLTKVLLGTLTGAAVGGPVGALIGGLAGAASAIIADDMVGYGARTLVTPSGPVALNNNDTVIAGTNLFKGDDVVSYGKGSLKLGSSDNSELIAAIKELGARPAVIDGARPFADNMGGQRELFTSAARNQSRLA